MSFIALCFGIACGGSDVDSEEPAEEGCDACTEEQVCVAHMGSDTDDHDVCEAIPAECGDAASCDGACITALYDLCDEGWLGVGCSDTYPPVIVSCNP